MHLRNNAEYYDNSVMGRLNVIKNIDVFLVFSEFQFHELIVGVCLTYEYDTRLYRYSLHLKRCGVYFNEKASIFVDAAAVVFNCINETLRAI